MILHPSVFVYSKKLLVRYLPQQILLSFHLSTEEGHTAALLLLRLRPCWTLYLLWRDLPDFWVGTCMEWFLWERHLEFAWVCSRAAHSIQIITPVLIWLITAIFFLISKEDIGTLAVSWGRVRAAHRMDRRGFRGYRVAWRLRYLILLTVCVHQTRLRCFFNPELWRVWRWMGFVWWSVWLTGLKILLQHFNYNSKLFQTLCLMFLLWQTKYFSTTMYQVTNPKKFPKKKEGAIVLQTSLTRKCLRFPPVVTRFLSPLYQRHF